MFYHVANISFAIFGNAGIDYFLCINMDDIFIVVVLGLLKSKDAYKRGVCRFVLSHISKDIRNLVLSEYRKQDKYISTGNLRGR